MNHSIFQDHYFDKSPRTWTFGNKPNPGMIPLPTPNLLSSIPYVVIFRRKKRLNQFASGVVLHIAGTILFPCQLDPYRDKLLLQLIITTNCIIHYLFLYQTLFNPYTFVISQFCYFYKFSTYGMSIFNNISSRTQVIEKITTHFPPKKHFQDQT